MTISSNSNSNSISEGLDAFALQNDHDDLQNRVKNVGRDVVIKKKLLLQRLLDESTKYEGKDMDKAKLLMDLVTEFVLDVPKVESIAAGCMDDKHLIQLFNLRMSHTQSPFPWSLNRPVEKFLNVPILLEKNMEAFYKAGYDRGSEASCRIQIDYMITACKVVYLKICAASGTDKALKVSSASSNRPLPLIIYPEMDLSVEVQDRRAADIRGGGIRCLWITGKADWALSYGDRKESGIGIARIAIEAKNPSTFSQGRNQLLTYLAIMKNLRQKESKTNEQVQGFYSDGCRYSFISISHDNTVYGSKTYDYRFQEERKAIFNWVVDLFESAAKSSPHTTPTEPGKKQYTELLDFQRKVFLRLL